MASKLKTPRSRRLNLRSACAEAERALADQRRFVLDAEAWAAFSAALERPPAAPARLRRLFAEPSTLER